VIVTGRMYRSVRPYVEQAGLDEPVVCYQGAVVADSASGEFLRHEPIPLELAREVIGAVRAAGVHLNCYVNDELYVAEHTAEAQAYASFQHIPVHEVGDLLGWLQEPPTKLVAVGEPKRLDALEERTVAFGDGENDVELLDWASYAVAVANAHERVLEVANFVCPPVNDEGVAQVLEAFLESQA
jgi:hydroxymethylpyrimidine pyrophosphatase-like HAD family hydrolase